MVSSARGRERERSALGREAAPSLVASEKASVPRLPEHYWLDETDPDIVALRRDDGTFVAAFSARGATKEGFVEAAREDYAPLIGRST
jgi:hypothetical protein